MKTREFLTQIKEYFWPILDPLKRKDFNPFKLEDLTVHEDDLDVCYDLTLKYYDSEDDRRKAIESKSTIFIGSIGFVIAILLSMATGLLLNQKIGAGFLILFSLVMWVIIVIYFCRAVWFAVKTLERGNYHTIDHKDFVTKKDNYKRELITNIINKTKKNLEVINLKVDNMVMAQEYFKRGIVTVVLYSLIAGIYGIFLKSSLDCQEFINTIWNFLKISWFPFVNAGCLLINIILFSLLRIRKSKPLSNTN